jgi:hypothetical protein
MTLSSCPQELYEQHLHCRTEHRAYGQFRQTAQAAHMPQASVSSAHRQHSSSTPLVQHMLPLAPRIVGQHALAVAATVVSPGAPMQPQAPVSGGWGGAPSPHMPAAVQPSGWGQPHPPPFQQPYPQQPPGAWGQPPQPPQPPPPGAPWSAGPPGTAYPGAAVQPAVPSPYPPGAVPPGQYPGAVPQGFPGAVGGVPPMGHHVGGPLPAGVLPQVEPQPEPVSSMAFPPGLLPTLCR